MRRFTGDDLPVITCCILAAGATCALYGYRDLSTIGAVVGLTLGAFTGFLLGYCLALIAEGFFGKRLPNGKPDDDVKSEWAEFRQWVMRLGQLGFMLVVAHEFYWLMHFQTLSLDYAIGRQVARAVEHGVSADELGHHVGDKRLFAQVASARPVRWCLRPSYLASHQDALRLVQLVERMPQPRGDDLRDPAPYRFTPNLDLGPRAPALRPEQLPPTLTPPRNVDESQPPSERPAPKPNQPKFRGPLQLVTYKSHPLWRTSLWRSETVSTRQVAEIGRALCQQTSRQFARDHGRTLLLRFLSSEFLLGKPLETRNAATMPLPPVE